MTETYQQRLDAITREAFELIRAKVAEKGKITILNEDSEDFQDEMYDVPFVIYVGKHGDYREYAILSLEQTDTHVKVVGYEKGEIGDVDSFTLEELYPSEMVWLADYLNT